MRPSYAPILLTVLALIFGFVAWKLDADAGSVRDALPPSLAAGSLPAPVPTSSETVLLADQTRLGSDLGSSGSTVASPSYAIRDTETLIRDVLAGTLSRAGQADELRQAVSLVRRHRCTQCLRLLETAARTS